MLNDFNECYLGRTATIEVRLGAKEVWKMFGIPTRKKGMGLNLR